MSGTECARCGDCCDPVTLGFEPETRARARLEAWGRGEGELGWEELENYEFMLAHWTTRRRVVGGLEAWYEVDCAAFNRATRLCGARETRPPVCRDFPWYGRPPEDVAGRADVAASLSPRCSFNRDVPGRALLPLTVVTR